VRNLDSQLSQKSATGLLRKFDMVILDYENSTISGLVPQCVWDRTDQVFTGTLEQFLHAYRKVLPRSEKIKADFFTLTCLLPGSGSLKYHTSPRIGVMACYYLLATYLAM